METPRLIPYTGRNTPAFCVTAAGIDYYFSYATCVAFRAPGFGLVVRENVWGTTTGRHLNEIDGGGAAQKNRVNGQEFEKLLAQAQAAVKE